MQTLNQSARSMMFLIGMNADRLVCASVIGLALCASALLFNF